MYYTFSSESFIWRNSSFAVIYDCSTGNEAELPIDLQLSRVIDEILDPKNLYTLYTESEHEMPDSVRNFLHVAVKIGCATYCKDAIDIPFSLAPILRIQKNRHFLLRHELFHEMLRCLGLVTIHLNHIGTPDYVWQQIDYPTNVQGTIDIGIIEHILCSIPIRPYIRYRLIGNMKDYPNLERVLYLFEHRQLEVEVCLITEDLDLLTEFLRRNNIRIKIVLPWNKDADEILTILEQNIELLVSSRISVQIPFYSTESERLLQWLTNHRINSEIRPFFNGQNREFILSTFSIEPGNTKISKREVFMNQAINSNFFGRVIITPDGLIRLSAFSSIIGSIHATTLRDILKAAMSDNSPWFMTRDIYPSCINCNYRYICPPISPVELCGNFDCIRIKNKQKDVSEHV